MFEDYRKYLTKLRNNLIQCGVEFPISPLITYRDSFLLGMQLDDAIWYYSVLAISGSEDAIKGYCLPLNMYYKEQMRQIFYQEFLDFVKDYRQLSILNMQLNGVQVQHYSVNSNILSEDEEIDLFEENETKIEPKQVEEEQQEIFIPIPEPEVHGVFLDSEPDLLSPVILSDVEYTDHGVMLDELKEPEEEITQDIQEIQDSSKYTTHGVILDDLPSQEDSIEGTSYDENGFEIEDEPEDSSDGILYDEDGFEIENETEDILDGILYDENGFEIVDEELESEENVEDSVLYDENGFEIVDDTGTIVDEVEDITQYDENGFEIVEEEENSISEAEGEEEGTIQYDENGFELIDEDDSLLPEESEDVLVEEESKVQSTHTSQAIKDSYNEKDVSDYIQDITNNLLTKGKRAIVQGIRKMKDD